MLKQIGEWLRSKTVVGAIVVIFGNLVHQYFGIGTENLALLVESVGSILFVIGARDAVRKLEK
ncbi:MAG: hypothetical protein ACE5D7_00850 [Fidelibacterota bacterium]